MKFKKLEHLEQTLEIVDHGQTKLQIRCYQIISLSYTLHSAVSCLPSCAPYYPIEIKIKIIENDGHPIIKVSWEHILFASTLRVKIKCLV